MTKDEWEVPADWGSRDIEDDGGDGWTLVYGQDEDGWAWELYEGNRLLDANDELSREQITEAQAWGAESMLLWDVTAAGWTTDNDRWTAKINGETS